MGAFSSQRCNNGKKSKGEVTISNTMSSTNRSHAITNLRFESDNAVASRTIKPNQTAKAAHSCTSITNKNSYRPLNRRATNPKQRKPDDQMLLSSTDKLSHVPSAAVSNRKIDSESVSATKPNRHKSAVALAA